MTDTNTLAPTDAEILALNAGEVHFSESPSKYPAAGFGTQYHAGAPGVLSFARAVLAAKWGTPALASSEPGPMLPETKYNLGWASGWDAHARAHPPESGPVGFDHKTAAEFLNGKTVTDEAVRQFIAHSRRAHDDRDWLRNTLADLRREITRRDAEIALLKTSLIDAESPTQATQVQEDVPDMFWDADDTESFAHEIQDIIDGYGPGEIVTIECAKRLPNLRAVVTRDGDGLSYEHLEAAIAAQQGGQ